MNDDKLQKLASLLKAEDILTLVNAHIDDENKRSEARKDKDGKHPKTMIALGGRSGKKLHLASDWSSCTDCGIWTKANMTHFKVADRLEAEHLANFCERCLAHVISRATYRKETIGAGVFDSSRREIENALFNGSRFECLNEQEALVVVKAMKGTLKAKVEKAAPEVNVERLKACFDLVKNADDWKAPISKSVSRVDLAVAGIGGTDEQVRATIRDAVVHFTATVPYTADCGEDVYVHSIGYRNGPAGDH
jgi:hypothetical protein